MFIRLISFPSNAYRTWFLHPVAKLHVEASVREQADQCVIHNVDVNFVSCGWSSIPQHRRWPSPFPEILSRVSTPDLGHANMTNQRSQRARSLRSTSTELVIWLIGLKKHIVLAYAVVCIHKYSSKSWMANLGPAVFFHKTFVSL